ncbi:MAG: hypothetical protein JO242_05890 [Streptosporangiaceae bacterium]|nr:hypothetical protein [Streptosporangiaceae bacterium]
MAMVLCAAAAAAVTACTASGHTEAAGMGQQAAGGQGGAAGDPPAARTQPPSAAVSVLASTAPDALTVTFARRLFSSAPVVVVARSTGAALPAAERAATAAHAPLLLSAAPVSAPLVAEIRNLHPHAVLAAGLAPAELAARLPGVSVVTSAADLPATGAPAPLRGVAVLVHRAASGPAAGAVTTTAHVAGAEVVAVAGDDPRADPAAISALANAKPREVLAIGRGFGPAALLADRVAVAATGTQLPGGGQVLFPGHRLVALYGHPGDPGLGVLGRQDLPASIARAQRTAALYRRLSRVPVIPAFEVIASVAQGSPGAGGDYSYESSVSSLRPWVRRATAAGMYVILDLQPGRANLLTQAKRYQALLAEPDVGLALDAEWKLQPGQMPLHQIGSVSIEEVNSVVRWLAALTARDHLPQKLLVLHQFRLSMISGERHLDTGHDDLAILIHMDGQGTPSMKQQTWDAVTGAAPKRVFFGWKNFYVNDHPMLSPRETMTKTPTPVMISYQ